MSFLLRKQDLMLEASDAKMGNPIDSYAQKFTCSKKAWINPLHFPVPLRLWPPVALVSLFLTRASVIRPRP